MLSIYQLIPVNRRGPGVFLGIDRAEVRPNRHHRNGHLLKLRLPGRYPRGCDPYRPWWGVSLGPRRAQHPLVRVETKDCLRRTDAVIRFLPICDVARAAHHA